MCLIFNLYFFIIKHIIKYNAHINNGDYMKKLIVLLFLVFIISTIYIKNKQEIANTVFNVQTIEPEQIIKKIIETNKTKETNDIDTYDYYKNINQDYFGYLSFENELINEPILKGIDNSFYLDHNINNKSHSSGSVFVDCRYGEELNNIILYGHYVYRDTSLMFSPLHKLLEDDYQNYDEFLIQYKDTNDFYQVVYALLFDITTDMEYYYAFDFHKDMDTFNKFNEFYANKSQIKNTDLDYDDKLVILQTCVRNQDNLRLIVIAKKVNK